MPPQCFQRLPRASPGFPDSPRLGLCHLQEAHGRSHCQKVLHIFAFGSISYKAFGVANAAATFMGLKIPTTKDLGGKRFTAYFTCEEPSCIVCRSGMSVDFPLGVQNVHPLVECICGKPMRLQDYDCVQDSDDEPADDSSDQMGSDDELFVASVTCMLFRCPVCFHTLLDTYTEHDTMMPHIPPLCCSTTCINAMRTGSRRRRLDFVKVAPRVATLVYGIVGTQQSGSADVDSTSRHFQPRGKWSRTLSMTMTSSSRALRGPMKETCRSGMSRQYCHSP